MRGRSNSASEPAEKEARSDPAASRGVCGDAWPLQTSVARPSDLNGDTIAAALRVNGKHLGAQGGHGRGPAAPDRSGAEDRRRVKRGGWSGTRTFCETPQTASRGSGASVPKASETVRP